MRYAAIEKKDGEVVQTLLFDTPQEAVRAAAFIAKSLGYVDDVDEFDAPESRRSTLPADWWQRWDPESNGAYAWDTEKQIYLLQGDEDE